MSVKATKGAVWRLVVLGVLLATVAIGIFPVTRFFYRTAYPLGYEELVTETATEYGFDPMFIFGIIHTESGFHPDAHSSADARGLMQVTPIALEWAKYRSAEWKDVTGEDLFDPEINVRVGVYILSLLRERFAGEETMLAAYNAGYGQVEKWLADPSYSKDGKTLAVIPFSETEKYVKRNVHAQTMYRKLYD